MRKLVANLKDGYGHISIHHKAQCMEFEARVFAGFFGDDSRLKEQAKKSLINCDKLDFICINGEILKGKERGLKTSHFTPSVSVQDA